MHKIPIIHQNKLHDIWHPIKTNKKEQTKKLGMQRNKKQDFMGMNDGKQPEMRC